MALGVMQGVCVSGRAPAGASQPGLSRGSRGSAVGRAAPQSAADSSRAGQALRAASTTDAAAPHQTPSARQLAGGKPHGKAGPQAALRASFHPSLSAASFGANQAQCLPQQPPPSMQVPPHQPAPSLSGASSRSPAVPCLSAHCGHTKGSPHAADHGPGPRMAAPARHTATHC